MANSTEPQALRLELHQLRADLATSSLVVAAIRSRAHGDPSKLSESDRSEVLAHAAMTARLPMLSAMCRG